MASIDVHAHVLLPEVEQAVAGRPGLAAQQALDLRRNGADSMRTTVRMAGERLARLTDVHTRLSDMDAAGVDGQVVSPSPSHYHYWTDPELASMVCLLANAGVAAHCAAAPDRLGGLGLVPLQHPELAVTVLEQAMTMHELLGVEISSHVPATDAGPARELSDPAYEPFWAKAAELDAVIFLHPFGCSLDERLDRWYLSNIVGQPTENAVALSHLIFAGVLDRHPGLKLLAAHGGGYLPSYLGRADHGWQHRSDARACELPPSAYLRRMWFDSLVYTGPALRHLIDAVGADRVLMGSDYPFDMGVEDPVQRLTLANLSTSDFDAIRGGNAAALFGLQDGGVA